jgi:hypothetical protein
MLGFHGLSEAPISTLLPGLQSLVQSTTFTNSNIFFSPEVRRVAPLTQTATFINSNTFFGAEVISLPGPIINIYTKTSGDKIKFWREVGAMRIRRGNNPR